MRFVIDSRKEFQKVWYGTRGRHIQVQLHLLYM